MNYKSKKRKNKKNKKENIEIFLLTEEEVIKLIKTGKIDKKGV